VTPVAAADDYRQSKYSIFRKFALIVVSLFPQNGNLTRSQGSSLYSQTSHKPTARPNPGYPKLMNEDKNPLEEQQNGTAPASDYGASSITALEGLEAVRETPGTVYRQHRLAKASTTWCGR
jgi:hypothetical protein